MDLAEAYDKIYRYSYYRLRDRETAEDVTQETFLRYMERYGNSGFKMKLMYTIARNICIDEYRRIKPVAFSKTYEVRQESYEEALIEKMALREALSIMDDELKELLLLRYVNEEPVGIIAEVLECSRFSVYRKLKKAAEQLKNILEVMDYEL